MLLGVKVVKICSGDNHNLIICGIYFIYYFIEANSRSLLPEENVSKITIHDIQTAKTEQEKVVLRHIFFNLFNFIFFNNYSSKMKEQLHSDNLHKDGGSYQSVIFGWGKNNSGQTGVNNNFEDVKEPVLLKSLWSMCPIEIACGSEHSLVLNGIYIIFIYLFIYSDAGLIYAFGRGDNGALGNTSFNNIYKPEQLFQLKGKYIKHIYAFGRNSYCIEDNGGVYVWGDNKYKQSGISSAKKLITLPRLINDLPYCEMINGCKYSTYFVCNSSKVKEFTGISKIYQNKNGEMYRRFNHLHAWNYNIDAMSVICSSMKKPIGYKCGLLCNYKCLSCKKTICYTCAFICHKYIYYYI